MWRPAPAFGKRVQYSNTAVLWPHNYNLEALRNLHAYRRARREPLPDLVFTAVFLALRVAVLGSGKEMPCDNCCCVYSCCGCHLPTLLMWMHCCCSRIHRWTLTLGILVQSKITIHTSNGITHTHIIISVSTETAVGPWSCSWHSQCEHPVLCCTMEYHKTNHKFWYLVVNFKYFLSCMHHVVFPLPCVFVVAGVFYLLETKAPVNSYLQQQ